MPELSEKLITSASKVAERLKERRETVAIAESSTGGLISAALLAAPSSTRRRRDAPC